MPDQTTPARRLGLGLAALTIAVSAGFVGYAIGSDTTASAAGTGGPGAQFPGMPGNGQFPGNTGNGQLPGNGQFPGNTGNGRVSGNTGNGQLPGNGRTATTTTPPAADR